MKLHQIPYKVAKKTADHLFWMVGFDRISRARITRRGELREIGSKYGGWVVPADLFDERSICYCVGCGEDISFDLGLVEQFGCDVYGFDPTPRAVAHVKQVARDLSKYHFHEVGLWDRKDTLKFYAPRVAEHVSHSLLNLQKTDEYITVPVDRLKHVMADLGHERLDLLKLDIEGAEYKVIESVLEDRIDIRVLCIEYDECFNPLDRHYKSRIRESVHRLMANGYALVHTQGSGNYTFIRET
ncbi:FkbM family methyltransferase [Ectothiorhodospiraceae bacterium WFHF3C12]|nr:FkbM family methyltransferase [Ectothiorhodospiraceae bacterium WFHF3C12]